MFNLSDDTKQKIRLTIKIISECFKVFMACLLSVFVPQNCDGEVCSFNENFEDLTDYNMFVVIWNFITLGSFIYLYWVDTRNEIWLINNFDQDRTKPDNFLSIDLEKNPEIKTELINFNKKTQRTYYLTTGLFISNFIFSAVLVLHFYYYDVKTITALLTNALLIVDKLINGITISERANRENAAISLYAKEPVLYNIIDRDIVKKLSSRRGDTRQLSENSEYKYPIRRERGIAIEMPIPSNSSNLNKIKNMTIHQNISDPNNSVDNTIDNTEYPIPNGGVQILNETISNEQMERPIEMPIEMPIENEQINTSEIINITQNNNTNDNVHNTNNIINRIESLGIEGASVNSLRRVELVIDKHDDILEENIEKNTEEHNENNNGETDLTETAISGVSDVIDISRHNSKYKLSSVE